MIFKNSKSGGGGIGLAHSFWILGGPWTGPARGLLGSDHACAPWARGLKGAKWYIKSVIATAGC